jgi:hypothetical protein
MGTYNRKANRGAARERLALFCWFRYHSGTIHASMAKFAIIQTGGKQYRVAVGDKVKVEKRAGEAGETLTFEKVLLVADGAGPRQEEDRLPLPFEEPVRQEEGASPALHRSEDREPVRALFLCEKADIEKDRLLKACPIFVGEQNINDP